MKSMLLFSLCRLCAESSCSDLGASAGENDLLQRNMFVQELLLSTLTEQLSLIADVDVDDPSYILETLRSPEVEGEQSPSYIQKENRNTNGSHAKQQSTRTANMAVSGAVEKRAEGRVARPVSAGTAKETSWSYLDSAASAGSPRQVCSPITVANSVAVHGPLLGSSGGVTIVQGRASSVPHGGSRDRGLNPASAKRSMLKHMPPPRGATDTDPPPH